MKKTMLFLWIAAMLMSGCAAIVDAAPSAPTEIVPVDPETEIAPVEPSGEPGDIRPPAAVILVNGVSQAAGIGTYCWRDDTQGLALCLDAIGIATQPEPLLVSGTFTAQFSLPVEGAPSDLRLNIRQATPELEMEEENWQGLRWWAYSEGGEVHALPLEQEPSLELSLAPGLYVLDLFASWQSLGDASYGFLLQVE
jgi:hypothetical protein